MVDRLSALDASFLHMEDHTTPMHVGGVAVFERPAHGLDYDDVLAVVRRGLRDAPRYRQKVVRLPGFMGRPVWVDDPDFDIRYHVRRSALPEPGEDEQLYELTQRLMSRKLDTTRPLWELHLIEGLSRGRVAVITKTHQAMIDGVGALDLGQLILDTTPERSLVRREDRWSPAPVPGFAGLAASAVEEVLSQPGELTENLRTAATGARVALRRMTGVLGGVCSTLAAALTTSSSGVLNAPTSAHRCFAVARGRLEDFRAVHHRHGGTVNGVILTTLAGALRTWLLWRGEAVTARTTVRALVPVPVDEGTSESGESGKTRRAFDRVAACLVDLPVGEPDPLVRLHQVGYAMRARQDTGQPVTVQALLRLSGFAPPTLHALGARVAGGLSDRLFNLLVTNAAGPQVPLYGAGALMEEIFPVVPLMRNQSLAIGITSYNGGVFIGLNADRVAVPDVNVLAAMIEESVEEMIGTVGR
ncbi:WS/DGAT/MGAT family O-acyltransferase [Actinopolyspora mortivallis]|uniref:WS/DGAT/MGAT family O-acyltransferase n=1 Tax=Actinopolyspora mortivallis TaxID=33906 RepID=UPI0003A1A761|nr:wax ester/triacylglycerol synthase family O-acyltransferase [Actinopolyspora mortivallis]